MNRPVFFIATLVCGLLGASSALATTTTYLVDPAHSFPSFEADHMGLSVWRGKFNKTSGKITLDKVAGRGEVDVSIDMASADFGLDEMNTVAQGEMLFETAKYPQAHYRGKLAAFVDGKPTEVDGELSLHGVTRSVKLKILQFKCMPHPMLKREVCGADALTQFQRDDYGMTAGKEYGFDMGVTLRIQVEAIAQP